MRRQRDRSSRGIPLLLVLVSLSAASSAAAAPAANLDRRSAPRRSGLGWDSGIAVRYRLGATWGLGVRVNPDLSDRDAAGRRAVDDPERTRIDASSGDRETDTFGAGIMIFRETRIGRWLGFGPYGELAFDRSRYSNDDVSRASSTGLFDGESETRVSGYATATRTWSVEFGVRPTFTIHDRFALESRLGVALRSLDTDYAYRSRAEWSEEGVVTSRSDSEYRTDSDGWSVSVFGEELGPGATLTFIAYF